MEINCYKRITFENVSAIRIADDSDFYLTTLSNNSFAFTIIDGNGQELDYLCVTRGNAQRCGYFCAIRKEAAKRFFNYDCSHGSCPVPVGISNDGRVLNALLKVYKDGAEGKFVDVGSEYRVDEKAIFPSNDQMIDRMCASTRTVFNAVSPTEEELKILMP